jgi:hypothetical protein
MLGVSTYVTFTGDAVVFISDSLIDDPVPLFAAFDMPPTAALDHPNVAPAVEEVIVYPRAVLLHLVSASELVITAVGLTVTIRLDGVPVHVA